MKQMKIRNWWDRVLGKILMLCFLVFCIVSWGTESEKKALERSEDGKGTLWEVAEKRQGADQKKEGSLQALSKTGFAEGKTKIKGNLLKSKNSSDNSFPEDAFIESPSGNKAVILNGNPFIYEEQPQSNVEGIISMIWVHPGTFIMGSPKDEMGRWPDEVSHSVTISQGFWLGKYEVTQEQYQIVMGNNPSRFKRPSDYAYASEDAWLELPVECVSWFDATNFCAKLTELEKTAGRLPSGYKYTLPTEAQWEYACRAGTTTALNSGQNFTSAMGYYATSPSPAFDLGWFWNRESTYWVGKKIPNAWGFYDMHGNVGEWCLDWYGAYPTADTVIDPMGPTSGSRRVYRGISWRHSGRYLRSAARSSDLPNTNYDINGFRVALVPIQKAESQFKKMKRVETWSFHFPIMSVWK